MSASPHEAVVPRVADSGLGSLGLALRGLRPAELVEPNAVVPRSRGSRLAWGRDRRLAVALILSDTFAVGAALLLALQWYGQSGIDLVGFALLPFVPLFCKAAGLYDRDRHVLQKTTLEEAPKLFNTATFYALAFWLVDSAFTEPDMTPQEVGLAWALAFALLVGGRAATRAAMRQRVEPERCLVLGDVVSAAFLQDRIERLEGGHGVVVGRVPLVADSDNGMPVLGELAGLGLVLEAYEIDRVIIAPGDEGVDTSLEAIRTIKALGVKVSVFPRLFEVLGSSVEFDNVAGVTLLGVRENGLPRSSYILKRGFDVAAAGLGALLLLPALAVIATAIKLCDGGSVFYRQRRIGRDGREFNMLKFRTMCADAEARRAEVEALNETAGLFKIADDPRVTRVGRLLRRASLDELPQLWNVLRGDMSLVGPRPLVPEEDEKVEGWQRRRLHVPPGMTGPWQILGACRVPLHEMVKIDYLYGANWTLWGDVKTILRTLPHMLRRQGL